MASIALGFTVLFGLFAVMPTDVTFAFRMIMAACSAVDAALWEHWRGERR